MSLYRIINCLVHTIMCALQIQSMYKNTADRPPTVSVHFGLSFGAKILTPCSSYELIMGLKMYYSKNYPSTSVYRKAITRAQNKLQVQSVEILQGCVHSMCNVLLVHVWESGRKHTAVMGRVWPATLIPPLFVLTTTADGFEKPSVHKLTSIQLSSHANRLGYTYIYIYIYI